MRTGGWSEEEIEETAQSFSDSAFDSGKLYHYQPHLELLEAKYPYGKLEEALGGVAEFMKNLERYLFPDVLLFLQKIPQKNVLLVTYGDEDFQKAKIRGAGIEKYFSEILVAKGEKTLDYQGMEGRASS
ncbi:MAG: hypothetical protein ABI747_02215 [Candidatus Moraniibacteriota bacterium]